MLRAPSFFYCIVLVSLLQAKAIRIHFLLQTINMKKIITGIILLMGVFLSHLNAFAQESKLIVKQKKIKRHYLVSPTDTLIIKNGFGKLIINTWDKNEITIDITASGKAMTKTRAQDILNNISIMEGKDTDLKRVIFFQTSVKAPYNNNNGVNRITTADKSGLNFEANVVYMVNAPKNITLDVKNTFGDVDLGDFKGKLNIEILHGHLHAKNISGSYKKISVVNSDILRDDGKYNSDNTITSIQSGEVSGGGKLLISKPIDTTQVITKGWRTLIINNVVQASN